MKIQLLAEWWGNRHVGLKTMTQCNAGKCDKNPRCETKTVMQASR